MQEKQLDKIIELLVHGEYKELNKSIQHIHPADIFEAISEREDAHVLLERLPNALVAEILDEADEEEVFELLKKFTKEKQREILNCMSDDEVADLIDELEDTQKKDVIDLLDEESREDVEKLLSYDSESAGGIMTTEFLALFEDKTIEATLRYIREEHEAETTYYLYVIDRMYRLKGVVSLRDIVSNSMDTKISEILNPHVISVHAEDDQEEVSRLFERYGFMMMPVVDANSRMLGVITVDDILEVMVDETTEDIHHLAGINKEEKVDGSIFNSVKSRLPWLCVNLITASISSSIINSFSPTIAQIVALSAVMTIITGMGGNAGTQALTLVVRGLSLGAIDRSNAAKIILKELGVGLVIGSSLGIFVCVICYVYEANMLLGVVAWIAMALNTTCAVGAGCVIPLILDKLGVDPALASGVFVTGVSDSLGFLLFLGLVTLTLPYLI